MFNNDDHKDRDYCCTPPVRKAGPYCGPVDTTPVGKPYNSHADCHHKPDCGYHIPPVPPFPPGTSLEFQMQALNHKMDELICKYNGCLDNYECVRNELLNSFCCNEAYYNEIWTEDYLDPTMNTNVHVVHIPFVDKCGRPIRLKLGLAYDNTGNIGATEEAYHASKRVLADKLFPANFTEKNTKAFVGPCIWNGVPYNFGNTVSTMSQLTPTNTLGITRSGFLKVYPITTDVNTQVVTIEQMQRDGIENAMDCLAYVLDSKAVKSVAGLTGPFVGVGMDFSTKERVIILVSGTPNEVSGDAISGLFTKYHCTVGVITCWGETASLMDKGQFVAMPSTVETSSTNPATQIVPYYNSFWYISKSEFYNSEYTKEVADLMQDVGALEWKYNMSMVAIESNNLVVAKLNQKIETEITDRKEADTTLDNRITQEVAELNSRIDEEVETLNESIAAVQKNLDDAVETINTRIDSEVAKLNQAIKAEETRAEAAESALDTKIEAETTRATQAETNLDTKIQAETTRATEAEASLTNKINAETSAREEAITSEANTRAQNDIVSVELNQDGTKNTYRLKTGGNTYLEVPIELYDYAMLVSKMQDLTNVQQNLAAEVEARQTADDEIRASVTKEASTRQTEDTKLQNQIDDLTEMQDDYVLKSGDTMTGDLNMGTHKVTGLATPTGNTDAANKEYVDNAVSGDYLPTTGGTMSGDIDMNGNTIHNVKDPVNAQDAANKEYVDAIGEGVGKNFLPTAGGTMSGGIDMSNNTISRLGGLIFGDNGYQLRVINEKFTFWTGGNTDADIQARNVTFSTLNNGDSEGKLAILLANNQVKIGKYQSNGGINVNGSGANGIVITGVGTPKNGADAANKKYVDDTVKSIDMSEYLPLSGGTMTGPIRTEYFLENYPQFYAGPKTPINRTGSPNKVSVISLGASNTGGFEEEDTYVTLSLNMIDNNAYLALYKQAPDASDQSSLVGIAGVNDPENAYDAANKKYVDDTFSKIDLSGYLPLSGGTMTGNLKFNGTSGVSNAARLGMLNNIALITRSHDNGVKGIAMSDEGNSLEATYLVGEYISKAFTSGESGIKFNQGDIYAGKFNSSGEFVDGSSGSGPVIHGIGTPSTNYDATNKLYVDSAIAKITTATLFPLSTEKLALNGQTCNYGTQLITARALYKAASRIEAGETLHLQLTVSGSITPNNIYGCANASIVGSSSMDVPCVCSYNNGWINITFPVAVELQTGIAVHFVSGNFNG